MNIRSLHPKSTSTIKDSTITKGIILTGLLNISVLVFSRLFTNATIPETDPVVMSNFGLLMIAIWGIAYISIAKSFRKVKWLIGLFAIEKLIYAIVWTKWIMNNELSPVFEKDFMAGLFFSSYGVNDWLAFLFYSFLFVFLLKDARNPSAHQHTID